MKKIDSQVKCCVEDPKRADKKFNANISRRQVRENLVLPLITIKDRMEVIIFRVIIVMLAHIGHEII